MLIDRERKLIFIHQPHAAGCAITRAWLEWDPRVEMVPGNRHLTARDAPAVVGDPDLSGWEMVAVARNPWELAFSSWRHARDKAARGLVGVLPGCGELIRAARECPTFREFCWRVYLFYDRGWWANHCCVGGRDLVRWALRFEQLDQDWREFAGRWGLRPELEITGRVEHPEPGAHACHWRDHYDDNTRALVGLVGQHERLRFGYTFE